MSDLSYRLVVLTHGDSSTLTAALAAFDEHVTPRPAETILVYDGAEPSEPVRDYIRAREGNSYWSLTHGPLGFCGATAYAWSLGAELGVEYAFYLEGDFEVCRPVDLGDLAGVLAADHTVAQMALMRDAANEREKAAGGLFESRPGEYEKRFPFRFEQVAGQNHIADVNTWLAHRSYFTTNPSLMLRQFIAANPWPDHTHFCEGKFGIELLAKGYSFGAWGDGSVYARHTGVRTRTGYGY